uniref:AB hydrolase-1 domain-containing protein n=1 Tax=Phytophthora ramorum TaxID=164328 RepID=H3GWI2_PHYRM
MASVHAQLDGAVNVYIMDHRGTGRSTRLDCSEASTTASMWGSEVKPSVVGDCAKELATKYGDLSSFSTTSAATDVAFFISEHTNGENTIVFGWSYGTALAERLMHLDPPGVTGYVLDGIASSSGAPGERFPYYSTWDTDFGEVADRFLALCEQDEEISARFTKKGLSGTIQHLITKLDRDPESTCAKLIKDFKIDNGVSSIEPPSFSLRRALGTLLSDADMRTLIPPVVYRLNRCASKDIPVLGQLVAALKSNINTTIEDVDYQSSLLFNLITFSEMWEMPAPSMSKMKKRFTDVLISDTGIYDSTELYCAFSKEESRACAKFTFGNYDANPLIYERDEYWNKSAVIPSQASVLLLSSKLDTQAPHKYAEYLVGALNGGDKELVSFDYATTGIVDWAQLATGGITCGMELLVSYVKNGGDLEMLDKSCLDEMPELNLTISTDYVQSYMLTTDAYDGKYDSDLSSAQLDK